MVQQWAGVQGGALGTRAHHRSSRWTLGQLACVTRDTCVRRAQCVTRDQRDQGVTGDLGVTRGQDEDHLGGAPLPPPGWVVSAAVEGNI